MKEHKAGKYHYDQIYNDLLSCEALTQEEKDWIEAYKALYGDYSGKERN
jgi:hypothetical protein